MNNCFICTKQTKWKYEVGGVTFPYCKKHQNDVQIYVALLTTENKFDPEKFLKNARQDAGEKVAKRTPKKGK